MLRKIMPVARRVLNAGDDLLLAMRWGFAVALARADGATLDDLREAVTSLEDTERTAQARTQWGFGPPCDSREQRSAPARPRRLPVKPSKTYLGLVECGRNVT